MKKRRLTTKGEPTMPESQPKIVILSRASISSERNWRRKRGEQEVISDIKNKDIMHPADILGAIHSNLVYFVYQRCGWKGWKEKDTNDDTGT
jgi:hypothetical protein